MKKDKIIRYSFTGYYDINISKERKRIAKCFRGSKWRGTLLRQKAILDALENMDWNKVEDLYDALPECPHRECTEKEYVGLWLNDMFQRFHRTDNRFEVLTGK